jgi:hypothetical protein
MLNTLRRNRVFFYGIGGSSKGEKMCEMTQEVGSQANVDRVRALVRSDRRLGLRLIAEELNMGICSEEKTRSLLTSVLSTMTMPLRMMH